MTEKSNCPDCGRPSVSPPAEVYCVDCATGQVPQGMVPNPIYGWGGEGSGTKFIPAPSPTPEIKALRDDSFPASNFPGAPRVRWIPLPVAIQAVRDTEARVREERHSPATDAPEVIMDANGNFWRRYEDGSLSMCPTSTDNLPLAEPVVTYRPDTGVWPDQSAQHAVLLEQVKDARREAFREAVEALRSEAAWHSRVDQGGHDIEPEEALAYFLERTFLSPDNPEGNA